MHDHIIQYTLELAAQAATRNEVPVAACVVRHCDGVILASAHNEVEQQRNPMAHAELLTIARACALIGEKTLAGCSLYVTLEPCAMCAGAIAHARLDALYFGAYDLKSGGVEHGARVFNHPQCHHQPAIYGGIGQAGAQQLLQAFFRQKRG